MSHLFAVVFDRPDGADAALADLQAADVGGAVELDDACIAQVPATEKGLLVRRAVAAQTGIERGLSANFWHHLLGHIWAHAHDTGRIGTTPGIGLDAEEVSRLAGLLMPGSSAVFALVRRMDATELRRRMEPVLAKHRGRVVHLPFGARQIDRVHASMDPVIGDPPTADELATEATAQQESEAELKRRGRERAAAEAAERLQYLRTAPLDADVVRDIVQRCRDAARFGETQALVYRFPPALTRDRGRTVNVGDPRWPTYLEGQPREVYAYFKRVLEPKGYSIEPRVLDYPGGIIGDLGFVVGWSRG